MSRPKLNPKTVAAIDNLASMWGSFDAAMENVNGRVLPSRPPGSVTLSEFATKYALCDRTARTVLAKLIKENKCTRVKAYTADTEGRRIKLWFYSAVK